MTMGLNLFELMTLGELISALEKVADKSKLVKTLGGTYVGGLCSYRGYYEDLAIMPRLDTGLTAGELLERARNAVGQQFSGWKGGEYTMDRDTPLWLADSGCSLGIGVKRIKERKYSVLLYGKRTSDA